MNRIRFLKIPFLTGAALAALISAYLLGSYRTLLVCGEDSARSKILLNSMYLVIADKQGDAKAIDRVLGQANTAVSDLGRSPRISLEQVAKCAILGEPLISDNQFIPSVWMLSDYRQSHPAAPFDARTMALIDRYPHPPSR